jgi:hypothetical protein
LQSENSARDQLAQQWSTFAVTTLGGTGGTYTELITCLEMKREAAKLPKVDSTTGQVTR